MRKSIVTEGPTRAPAPEEVSCLDLASLARVEVTSEEPSHPVEAALLPGVQSGWRAAAPGKQTVRLLFDSPQQLRRIRLRFEEPTMERSQEFVLRWSVDGTAFRDVVRQQWNFSPAGATTETEEYQVDLHNVAVLELTIMPDLDGGEARATLAELRLA